jgi:addiction module RelE/StbE family toxin
MSKLILSEAFQRKLSRFIKSHKELTSDINSVFVLLEKDINSPSLKTHKLKGKLAMFYSCSINYHYRIIFLIEKDYIYLHSIGSHDDVY